MAKLDTDFFHRVYGVVMSIPEGCVTTYGAIGQALGLQRSARMVGHALASLVDDPGVPCHRVVNHAGMLSGAVHFGTPTLMRELLEAEGVRFKGERVDMKRHFWQPEVE